MLGKSATKHALLECDIKLQRTNMHESSTTKWLWANI